jgi:hypothetical protein
VSGASYGSNVGSLLFVEVEPPLIRAASPITALVDRSFVLTKAPDGEDTIAVSLLVYAL